MGNKGKYNKRRKAQKASNSGAPSPPGSTSGISSAEASSSGVATPNTETCHQMITENLADSMSKLTLSAKMVNRDENRASSQASTLPRTSTVGPSSSAVGATRNRLIRKNEHTQSKRSVTLASNMSRIQFKDPTIRIFMYDIEMKCLTDKEELSRGEKLRIFEEIDSEYLNSKLAWDEKKILYGLSNTIGPIDKDVTMGEKKYHVKLQLAKGETSPEELIRAINKEEVLPQNPTNALNVILSHCIKRNALKVKSAFYPTPQTNRVEIFHPGIQLWKGTRVRITPTDGFGITLRFIRKHQAFVKGDISLSDFIEDNKFSLSNSQLTEQDRKKLSSLLKGMKVTPIYAKYPRKLAISNVSTCDANNLISDKSKTIKSYLEEKYKSITVSKPNLNCIVMTNKNVIPIDLLKLVPYQPYYKNNDAKWQAQILKNSCIKPENFIREGKDSKRDIEGGMEKFKNMLEATIESGFESTTGNLLCRDSLCNGRENCSNDRRININIIAFKGCHINEIKGFCQELRNVAGKIRLNVYTEKHICYVASIDDIRRALSREHHNIIIGEDLKYGEIKLLEKYDYHTQCVKYSTVTNLRRNFNTMKNILLKLNIKAGGTNWSIPFPVGEGDWRDTVFRESVMIVGADVTHFTDGRPSIAAVVCSSSNFDFTAGSSYNFKIAVQYPEGNKKSLEYIKDMKNIMIYLLRAFYSETHEKPAKIIYYRDGVSMGQFENTVFKELEAIQGACTSLEEIYEPKISIVVCTKRHDQRFLRKDGNKFLNPDIGTVVSKNLVTPNYFNFFLFSQKIIKGTGVPCHYYVLYDDNKLGAYFWHNFTFLLCHLYARCKMPVSYPAPVYYAHLACYSSRTRFEAKYGRQNRKYWQGDNRPQESQIEEEITPQDKDYMFYI